MAKGSPRNLLDYSPQGKPKRLTFDNAQGAGIAWTGNSREIVFSSSRGAIVQGTSAWGGLRWGDKSARRRHIVAGRAWYGTANSSAKLVILSTHRTICRLCKYRFRG